MATNDDPSVVIDQLYTQMRRTSAGLDKAELDSVVADIRVNTTIQGASTLEVDVIDPEWALIASGILDLDARNRLPKIDLNFPDGSNMWWRLTQADLNTGRDGPNLTMTFEDRVVSYAREKTGPKSWSRAHFTRAQAIKAMTADEIKSPPEPLFVSPELDERQPVAVGG